MTFVFAVTAAFFVMAFALAVAAASAAVSVALLFTGFAHSLHFSCEVQGLSRHRMIEVHRHALFSDCGNHSLDDLSCGIVHRDEQSGLEQIFADPAVFSGE